MAPSASPSMPAQQQQRIGAAYPSHGRNYDGMPHSWYSVSGQQTNFFSGLSGLPQRFIPIFPGLRTLGPPPPRPAVRINGEMASQPGSMHSQKQGRLCFPQHAAIANTNAQTWSENQKQSARDLDGQLPAGERGLSNSLSGYARPFGGSTRAPASSFGRSEASTVGSTSSSTSLQSSDIGKQ